MLAIGLVQNIALHQSTKPLSANHFWITSATCRALDRDQRLYLAGTRLRDLEAK